MLGPTLARRVAASFPTTSKMGSGDPQNPRNSQNQENDALGLKAVVYAPQQNGDAGRHNFGGAILGRPTTPLVPSHQSEAWVCANRERSGELLWRQPLS